MYVIHACRKIDSLQFFIGAMQFVIKVCHLFFPQRGVACETSSSAALSVLCWHWNLHKTDPWGTVFGHYFTMERWSLLRGCDCNTCMLYEPISATNESWSFANCFSYTDNNRYLHAYNDNHHKNPSNILEYLAVILLSPIGKELVFLVVTCSLSCMVIRQRW